MRTRTFVNMSRIRTSSSHIKNVSPMWTTQEHVSTRSPRSMFIAAFSKVHIFMPLLPSSRVTSSVNLLDCGCFCLEEYVDCCGTLLHPCERISITVNADGIFLPPLYKSLSKTTSEWATAKKRGFRSSLHTAVMCGRDFFLKSVQTVVVIVWCFVIAFWYVVHCSNMTRIALFIVLFFFIFLRIRFFFIF